MTDEAKTHENPSLVDLNANYRAMEAGMRDEAAPIIAEAIEGMRQVIGRQPRRAQKNLRAG